MTPRDPRGRRPVTHPILVAGVAFLVLLPAASAGPIEDAHQEAEATIDETQEFVAWFVNRTLAYADEINTTDNATEVHEKMQGYLNDVVKSAPNPVQTCILRGFSPGPFLPSPPSIRHNAVTGRITGAEVRGDELVMGTYYYEIDLGGNGNCGPGSTDPLLQDSYPRPSLPDLPVRL